MPSNKLDSLPKELQYEILQQMHVNAISAIAQDDTPDFSVFAKLSLSNKSTCSLINNFFKDQCKIDFPRDYKTITRANENSTIDWLTQYKDLINPRLNNPSLLVQFYVAFFIKRNNVKKLKALQGNKNYISWLETLSQDAWLNTFEQCVNHFKKTSSKTPLDADTLLWFKEAVKKYFDNDLTKSNPANMQFSHWELLFYADENPSEKNQLKKKVTKLIEAEKLSPDPYTVLRLASQFDQIELVKIVLELDKNADSNLKKKKLH